MLGLIVNPIRIKFAGTVTGDDIFSDLTVFSLLRFDGKNVIDSDTLNKRRSELRYIS